MRLSVIFMYTAKTIQIFIDEKKPGKKGEK